MTNINATARKVYKLSTDCKNPELIIKLADSISPHGGLDSLDLGDALGAFMEYLDAQEDPIHADIPASDAIISGFGIAVTISYEWELFEWEGLPE
jgi:hypothetical protein